MKVKMLKDVLVNVKEYNTNKITGVGVFKKDMVFSVIELKENAVVAECSLGRAKINLNDCIEVE